MASEEGVGGFLKVIADIHLEIFGGDQLVSIDVLIDGESDVGINSKPQGVDFDARRQKQATKAAVWRVRQRSRIAPAVGPHDLRQRRDLYASDRPGVIVTA